MYSQIVTPVTKNIMPLVALLFTDDTDLHVINSGSDSAEEVAKKTQKLLDAWYSILRFIGGDPKLSKCYWTMQDYQ